MYKIVSGISSFFGNSSMSLRKSSSNGKEKENPPSKANVLITQCIQQDFVGLAKNPNEPIVNQLHIGETNAKELKDRVSPFMSAIRKKKSDVVILHIVDHHDRNDRSQDEHLLIFGDHCINPEGQALAFDLQDDNIDGNREILIKAKGLDDIEETEITEKLVKLMDENDIVRVAVIGVWTDVKVTLLLRALRDQLGIQELATSSDLTASPNRSAHDSALKQLEKEGIQVFKSVGYESSNKTGSGLSGSPYDHDQDQPWKALFKWLTNCDVSTVKDDTNIDV
eukprot:TRINITY_DN4764_c0_g1_i1.p1 TRINITY_DN4764_c0_g1~~TRINITY_DN4764_c0_g1_i1.p1  ORF type:complete len:281 (+),score=64.02 TRINITY_DN4764_c0_g1_i1:63-905(+)